MAHQRRDQLGRFSHGGPAPSQARLAPAGFDLEAVEESDTARLLGIMDSGADPRLYIDDDEPIIRVSAASRAGLEVKDEDRDLAEVIAA